MTRVVMRGGKLLTVGGKLTTCESACCCPSGSTSRIPSLSAGDWNGITLVRNPSITPVCANNWKGTSIAEIKTIANGTLPVDWGTDPTNFALSTFDADGYMSQAEIIGDTHTSRSQTRIRGRVCFYVKRKIDISYSISGANVTFTVNLSATWHFFYYYIVAVNYRRWTKPYKYERLTASTYRQTSNYQDYAIEYETSVPIDSLTLPTPYAKQTATWPPEYEPYELRNKNHSCYHNMTPCWTPRYALQWLVNDTDTYQTWHPCNFNEHGSTATVSYPDRACPVYTLTGQGTFSSAFAWGGLFTEYQPRVTRCGIAPAVVTDGPTVSCPNPATLPNTSSEVPAGISPVFTPLSSTVVQTTSVLTRRGPGASANTTISRSYSGTFDKTDFVNEVSRDYVINLATQDGDLRTISGVATVGIVGGGNPTVTVPWGPENLPNLPASITLTI